MEDDHKISDDNLSHGASDFGTTDDDIRSAAMPIDDKNNFQISPHPNIPTMLPGKLQRKKSLRTQMRRNYHLEFYKVLHNDGIIRMCLGYGIKTLFSNLGILTLVSKQFVISTKPRLTTTMTNRYKQSMNTKFQIMMFKIMATLTNVR